MKKKITVLTLCAMLFAPSVSAEAQQPQKIPLIGRLSPGSPSANPARTEAFRQGLRELEYVEGKNIVIERRSAEGRLDRLPALAAELVRLKVDIIVTAGPAATRAAKEATSTIPIVMTNDSDPVATGFIASLSHPGGNITGLSTFAPELSGKQLELLKEVVPKLSRVAVLGTSTSPSTVHVLKEIELAARALKVKFQFLDVQNPEDIESTFRAIKKERAEAVLLLANRTLGFSANTGCRPRGKEPTSGDVPLFRFCRSRGAYELRHELYRLGPARRYVCGQDFERQEAR
jgi:putative ABC transport system substrate-binding protein